MATTTRSFSTESEALAFVEGLEYVNDSTISDIQVAPDQELGWGVTFDDADGHDA
jgi:hypothetical protein